MYENIVFATLFGGLAGVIGHVKSKGKMIMPRKTKKFIYLGFFEDFLTGAMSAALLVLSSGINSVLNVLFISIVAGLGGEALIRKLELIQWQEQQDSLPEKKPDNCKKE
ncbi:hypothetical protein CVD25_11395 [Bacillus canaveralius]|uniref:Uncharacterized protein n=1 Tax=Bacillus canaveralius TaxID=1403243 RepID=A0A2N5GK41_9BACI|nr:MULTISPECIES: DUF4257 domain-containing protein [Bacillus]PLR81768.1 hypothetical protein CU635_14115 [Bacillus canaveralius]PLR86201.1 hypothetical protein CVD23_07160 [Bacillus sp. V33-4]PLR96714.1 hypothetical protein CVD25_11395 [Bacillus canaveralius]RSK49184.1 DUF4257 domain-containing protein [Bacillus canaveralius]